MTCLSLSMLSESSTTFRLSLYKATVSWHNTLWCTTLSNVQDNLVLRNRTRWRCGLLLIIKQVSQSRHKKSWTQKIISFLLYAFLKHLSHTQNDFIYWTGFVTHWVRSLASSETYRALQVEAERQCLSNFFSCARIMNEISAFTIMVLSHGKHLTTCYV